MPDDGCTRDVVKTIRYTWSVGQQCREERTRGGRGSGKKRRKERKEKHKRRADSWQWHCLVFGSSGEGGIYPSKQCIVSRTPGPDGADTLTEHA